MALQYSPKIVTDSLVMCLDPSQNKSYPAIDLPVKNGLVMWMDAADDTTFSYSSGTTVSQWRDKSGFNYHMVPVSAGPTRNSFLNSRKTLTITNAQQIGNLSINLSTSANTVFVVSRLTGGANGRVLTAYYNNWLLGHWGGYVNEYYAEGWIAYAVNAADTTWRMYMGDWGGPTNDTANAFSNGSSIRNAPAGDAAAGPSGLVINSQGWEQSNCEIAEIIVFNRLLSATERKQIHTYLGQKWGILNTDRSIIDLSGLDDSGLLGNGSTSNMPLYDYYNKGAFKFFASNKYIKLGNNTNINQFTGDFTVSLWAMATAENSNYGNLIGDYYTAGVQTTNEWQIMMNNSSAFLNVYRHGTGYIINNTSSGFSANTWINVVLTRAGTTVTLYANNNVIGTATNSSVFGSATGSVNIGIDGNNSAEPFSGLISNVLIYKKGLSAAEVAQNYEAQKSRFANTIVQQGLALNLDAGNPYSYAGAGTVWYDTSGNSNNGTLTNGPTYNADAGGNVVFDGSNDYVAVTSAASIKNTSTLSLEGWVLISSAMNYYGGIIGKGTTDSDEEYCLLVHSVNSKVYMDVGSGGGPYTDASFSFSLNTWYHIIGTHERIAGSSTIKIYVNGSLLSSSTVNPTNAVNDNATNASIGSRFNGGTSVWNGKIATARIYTRTLSANEVLQNYNATKGRFGL